MKKLFALLCAVCMLFTLTACAESEPQSSDNGYRCHCGINGCGDDPCAGAGVGATYAGRETLEERVERIAERLADRDKNELIEINITLMEQKYAATIEDVYNIDDVMKFFRKNNIGNESRIFPNEANPWSVFASLTPAEILKIAAHPDVWGFGFEEDPSYN
jgi:predicted metal-dependent phosphoesterase TrpH